MKKIIKNLILSDFLLQSAWGLIGPIFAIFLTRQIKGGSLAMVGFVVATYWFTKSIFQPFIAHYLDLKKGEKDDFYFLIGGMYLANLIPLGYFFSTRIEQIFFLEAIRGLAMACVVPTWSGIFTRHIDVGWEAFSWSVESTGIGFAAGFSAALGGIIASILGFKTIFVLVTFFGLLASSILFSIRHQLFSKEELSSREKVL